MIALNHQEIQFMLTVLALSEDLRKHLTQLELSKDILISDDMADELRELCTDRLDTHGFDASYKPTEEGKRLEALIDKLYH